jgi:hypothetical protein
MTKDVAVIQIEMKKVDSNINEAIQRRHLLQQKIQSKLNYHKGKVSDAEKELRLNSDVIKSLNSQAENCKALKDSSLGSAKEKLKKAVNDSKEALNLAITADKCYSEEVIFKIVSIVC